MRYVAASPWRGQIGHQFSAVWYAKLFSEMFDFQYLHAPFVDNPAYPFSRAACWNDFFNIGAGERLFEFMRKRVGTLEHFFGEYHGLLNLNLRHQALARLADAVPDQYVMLFKDLGQVSAVAIRAWEKQNFIAAGTLEKLCRWFQDKLAVSPVYQAQTPYQHPEGMVRVAVYWRNFHPAEATNCEAWPRERVMRAIEAVRQSVFPRPISVVICSQFWPAGGPLIPDASHVGYLLGDDPNCDLRMVYKTLIEADVAITTVGGSASLIGVYRAFKRPTLGLGGWLIDGFQMPEHAEDFLLPERFINVA